MPDFLLELRSEEIPARMQARAREDLARLFAAELAAAGLNAGDLTTYATPRRLALIARDLPAGTPAVSEELKGPRASAPLQALEGFLRKTGLTRDQLVDRDGVLYAVTERPGRATADVLAAAVPAIVRAFPWPKSMRWGAASLSTESVRWVRPLQGIVALFGDDLVECEVAGIRSGAATLGHRFHHPGPITLRGAADYVDKLRACHVIVDAQERAHIIRTRAAELARDAGLELVEDEGLVAENAGLTEWPVPLLGRFDEAFLQVPPEVIRLTARVNQKYFVCRTPAGDLAPAFICTANIAAADDGARVVEGNRKVLAARLSDARFFYDGDLKVPLEEQAAKLDAIVFHEKLGTVADKVDRVAKLAEWLATEKIVPNCDPALARRAAKLCKADLVTGMVGEFPELQGVMGGYYAAAQGEHPAVAEAIRDHYKPVGQGDDVPTAPVTVAVSLADKLDTIVSFFYIQETPNGSRDPFALRRAAISCLAIILRNRLKLGITSACSEVFVTVGQQIADKASADTKILRGDVNTARSLLEAAKATKAQSHEQQALIGALDRVLARPSRTFAADEIRLYSKIENVLSTLQALTDFFADRLKVQQREAGVRHDLIDAVFALGGEDDLVRLLARVRALQAFVGTGDGANLLAGYKRAANILKKEGWISSPSPLWGESRGEGLSREPAAPGTAPLPGPLPEGEREQNKMLSYTPEPAEEVLRTALDSAEPRAAAAVDAEEFEGAMAALASLRAPIDAFFDTVTVNDPDPAKREARLALLARVRNAVHRVADFSRIEG